MMNSQEWCVIENAGYAAEINAASFESYKEAKQYIEDNYTDTEKDELHIEITRDGSYEH